MFGKFPDDLQYRVVINHEEQYSIWPVDRENPSGWKSVAKPEVQGFSASAWPPGDKAKCLEYIEEVWTDMRPLSVHDDMARRLRDAK